MEFDELIKKERELTGMTQSLFAEITNSKYKEYGINLTSKTINTIEHTGTIGDVKLRNVFLYDFYFIDIEREKEILSFAYKFVDYITNRRNAKEKETSFDLKELFSYTRKEELYDFIITRFENQTTGNTLEEQIEKKSIKDRMDEIMPNIADEISLKYVETKYSNTQSGISLNDSAKLVFYIAYYLILLTHKKKDIKEKTIIRKEHFSAPGFKEAIVPFTNEDDFDTKTGKVKGKMIKSINERFSLMDYLFKNESIKYFYNTWEKDIIPLMPIKDTAKNIETDDPYYQLFNDLKKVDLKNIDYENENIRSAFKNIYKTNPFSTKSTLLQCYAMYQYQYPSMTMVKELDAKIKELDAKIKELDAKIKNVRKKKQDDYQLDSPRLEEVVSNIVEELESMYEKYKGEFTLELYSNFYKKQQFLFQLYREYDYMGFLLFKTREKK